MKIYPYNQGSASAKALAQGLGIKRIKHEGKPIQTLELVINWGASVINRDLDAPIIANTPNAVKNASNKLEAFKLFQGRVACPEWTASRDEAMEWRRDGFDIVVREVLNGHSGEGITIQTSEDWQFEEVIRAPLYTKYIKKKEEYRVHVMEDDVFFIQRKARKMDVPDEEVDWQVRNHKNGFIYANQWVDLPEEAKKLAIDAIKCLNLDFGAVDIILGTDKKYYVLEVNTAPGLTGATLEKYIEKFELLK